MAETRRPPEVDRAAASRRAVEARRERAALKRDVSTRVISPQELLRRGLADPLSAAGAMRVTEFLTASPRSARASAIASSPPCRSLR